MVDNGQTEVIAAVQQSIRAQEQFIEQLVAILSARAAVFDKDASEQTRAVEQFQTDLGRIAEAQTDVRDALLGGGETRDLITVLRRLDDTVSRLGMTWRH
jgi:hypothetical protein